MLHQLVYAKIRVHPIITVVQYAGSRIFLNQQSSSDKYMMSHYDFLFILVGTVNTK